MVLHEDKFELLVHRGNPNESLYELPFVCQTQTYQVSGGNMLYPTDQVKDLGVIVSYKYLRDFDAGSYYHSARPALR